VFVRSFSAQNCRDGDRLISRSAAVVNRSIDFFALTGSEAIVAFAVAFLLVLLEELYAKNNL
jgi:hypothetical protein